MPSTDRVWWDRGSPETSRAELHAAALSMLVARRAMRGTLPAHFLHDPSLEMLLTLYLGDPASVVLAELVAETTVPPTVARHWVEALRAEALVALDDGSAALTARGRDAMDAMLAAVVGSQREMLGWGNH